MRDRVPIQRLTIREKQAVQVDGCSSASNQRVANNYKPDPTPPLTLAEYRKVPVNTGKYGTGIYR
jgi:hypothetical protein